MKSAKFIFITALIFLFNTNMTAQTWTSYQSTERVNDLVDTGTELFMGTQAGLVVMNKLNMQCSFFNRSNSNLSDNHIISVAQAPNGNIWVATEGGTLEEFTGSNFQSLIEPGHSSFSSAHTEFIDFEIAPNGDFWIASDDGVFHRQGANWLFYAQAQFGSDFFEAWDIEISPAGDVYVATTGVFKFSGGVWSSISGSSSLSNYLHADMFISSTGDLFMSGDLSKIGRYDGSTWQEYTAPINNGSQIKDFAEDSNGDIYVMTQYDGIYKLTGNTWIKETDAQAQASDDKVQFMHIDAQNKRWLNYDIQLSVKDGNNVQTTLIAPHTLETGSTRKLSKSADGSLYVVTYSRKNISVKDASGNWSFLPTPTHLTATWEYFTDIIVFSASDIWLSSDQGLYHYDGNSWTNPLSQTCRSMTHDSQGKIYIRGNNAVFMVDNGNISEFNSANSPISSGAILNGHGIDADDNLWFSEYENNILRKVSTDGVWTEYTQNDHPALDDPYGDFHFDINGNLWMRSDPFGVIKFDGTNFTNPFTGNVGQMANYDVNGIESDASGMLFFAHQYGVTTYDNGQWGDLLINEVPHIQSIFDATVLFDNTGTLWWASNRYGVFAMPNLAVLPVNLSDFEVKVYEEDNTEITWQTTSEFNNDFFSLEHSRDGTSFSEITRLNGAGTSSERQDYAFSHENLNTGLHYYRLKQTDFDGKYVYSNILSVRIKNDQFEIALSPNPTRDFLTIQSSAVISQDSDLQIIDGQGQLITSRIIPAGTDNILLDLSELPQGIYFLRMSSGQSPVTKRIVKMR